MQSLLHNITTYLLTQSTHIILLFIALALICLALKNKSAHLRYLLWLLLIAKCLLPSLITVPLAVLPEKQIASPAPAPAAQLPEYTFPPVEVPYTPASPLLAPKTSAPAPPPPEPSLSDRLAKIPPKTYFASFWLIGLTLFLLITLTRAVSLNLRFRRKRIPLTDRLADETGAILNRFSHLKPPIYLLLGIGQPFVWGLIRGSIYLPADFTKTTTTSRRRAILAHELAHVKRFDALVNLLQIIVQAVFWFHPFVWLANKLIRAEREKACDETAIAKLSASPKDYSSAIVDTIIAEYKSTMPVPSLAVAGPIKNIEDRIKTVMTPGKKFYTRPTFIALVTILLLAAVIAPTTIALTTRKPKPEETLESVEPQTPSQFKATLPNGTTVELLGVCEHPSQGKQWWAPDGVLLNDAPYYTTGNRCTDEKKRFTYYEFAMKLNPPDDISYYWMIPDSGHGSDTGSPSDKNDRPIRELKAYAANLPVDSKTSIIRIGTTADPWKTIVSHKPQDREKTHTVNDFSIAFGIPYRKDSETLLPVVHNYNRNEREYAIRVIVVTKTGQIRKSGYSGSGGNKLNSLTYSFHELPLDQIKEFQFQTRPYQFLTFKNVSLQPGKITNVQIIQSTPAAHQPEETPQPKPIQHISFKKDMLLIDALRFLAIKYQKNIIPSAAVANARERITVTDLYDITSIEQVLQAILGSHKYVIDDNFIRIYTQQEFDALPPDQKTTTNTKTERSSGENNKQNIEIGGTVSDENNQAIPNATVKVTWDVVMGMVMLDTETAQTDLEGRWSCSVPSNVNHFSIGLQHPKHYSSEFTYEPPVEKLKDKTSVLVMIRGLKIAGKVVDRNGNPVANALLMPPRSVISISAKDGLVESPATTRTEQDGTFRLAGLKKQKQKIVVDAEGFSPTIFEFDPEKDYSDNIIISLPEPTVLKGIVRDNQGNPMPNVQLETDNWEVKRPEYELKGEKYCSEYEQYIILRRKTTTDEKGEFALSSLPSYGRLELIIVPKDQDGFLLCNAYPELPSEKIVEFTLYPVPVLSGKVIDKETEQPIKDISITTGLQWKPEDKINWRVRSHKSHSEDGTFETPVTNFLFSDPSNSVALRIVADSYLPYVTPSIRVDKKPESMLVRLQKADDITGFFLSHDREPIAEMEVAWAGPDKKIFIKDYEFQKGFAHIPEYFVKTDKDGSFKFPPSGRQWTIVALHKTGYFILSSDTYKPAAEYRLIPWATVKGTIWKNPSDITVPKMSLFQLIDMEKIRWDFYISTNLDGSFKYDYVPSIPLRPQWNHKSSSGSYDPVTFNQGTDYSVNITENAWQWNPIPKKYNETTSTQTNQNTKTKDLSFNQQ